MNSNERVNPGRYFEAGNVAVAEGALYAGLEAYYGYPITPASEIMEYLAHRLPALGGSFFQLEDEIASITAAIGASWCRKKVMTATSGPGFSLMQEGIGLANWTETPIVIAESQRLGPSTGIPTFPGQGDLMQVRFGSHGDYLNVCLTPGTVQECFDLTIQAYNITELLRVPVILLLDQQLSSVHGTFEIPETGMIPVHNRATPGEKSEISEELVPPMACFGEGRNAFSTGLTHTDEGLPMLEGMTHEYLTRRLFEKIEKNTNLLPKEEQYQVEDAEILIVAYGSSSWTAYEAVDKGRENGLKVGLFRPRTVWPFPEQTLTRLAEDIDYMLVVEMSNGQLLWSVERCAKGMAKISNLPNIRGRPSYASEILPHLLKMKKS